MREENIGETTGINEDMESGNKHFEDISKTSTRFYMLFLACFLCFGYYLAYDSPTAIQKELENVKFS